MIPLHSLHVAFKQYYLHSIHFHSFPFLYFKTSNQDYLIPSNSILFHSFLLLKYIPFHSFQFPYYYSIQFHSLPLWTPKQSLRVLDSSPSLAALHLPMPLFLRSPQVPDLDIRTRTHESREVSYFTFIIVKLKIC